MKRITIRLTDSMNSWLNREFPHGFKQEFVETCFTHLRNAIEKGELPPPSEYARAATLAVIYTQTEEE